MRIPITLLALAATACSSGPQPGVTIDAWVGDALSAEIRAFAADGTALGVAATEPALDGPPLALGPRAAGGVLVAQDPAAGPALVALDRAGQRVLAFAGTDDVGAALFEAGHPPHAIATLRDGTVWVTGREAPVRFDAAGGFLGRAAPLPSPSAGLAQLPDGRVAVAFNVPAGFRLALYAEDGAGWQPVDTGSLDATPNGASYGRADAVAAAGGELLVALEFATELGATEGTVIRLALAGETATLVGELAAAARLAANVPSTILRVGDELLTGPSAFAAPPEGCVSRLAADLSAGYGCIAAGTHRGVALVPRE